MLLIPRHSSLTSSKVQHSGESRVQITIPKRGEKDFEPLAETVKLQEMMLQRSREALFGALQGVRGGAGYVVCLSPLPYAVLTSRKSVSHALLTPHSPYPTMLVTRGHLLDTMGITVRQAPSDAKGKGKASIQLLPEEALFLLERGSLQIWMGEGEWDDEIWGVPGAVEMSVAEAFSAFLGKDGLSWERYQVCFHSKTGSGSTQPCRASADMRCGDISPSLSDRQAYAVLKRLGYTVQRTRRFIPAHFLAQDLVPETFRSWWLSIPGWLSSFARSVYARVTTVPRFSIWNWLRSWRTGPLLLSDWRGTNFGTSIYCRVCQAGHSDHVASLFAHLRIIPTGHTVPLKPRAPEVNPYLPFYHVWKPAYPWAKNRWDKGSAAGLAEQPPSYHIAAVE